LFFDARVLFADTIDGTDKKAFVFCLKRDIFIADADAGFIG